MERGSLSALVLLALASSPHRVWAQEEATAKIAVVVAGDPDDALRERARELEAALDDAGELLLPSDPALRAALRGEAGEPGDGLERARTERRRLGLDDAEDARALRALGRMTGAVAVVVVRRGPAGIEALVLDVPRGSFFDDEVALPSASAVSFVTRRARASARAASREDAPAERAPPPTPTVARTEAAGEDDDEDDGILSEWPLIVAGALLVGFLLFFALDDEPAERGPPVLRFTAGGR